MVRVKENLIHKVRNIEETGDCVPTFKVVTTVTNRFSNNSFMERERQECDMKKAIGNT